MAVDLLWLLLALPVAFAVGWVGSRFDLRQWRGEQNAAPKAYYKGLNLLLNEQQDKAIDAFIEAVQLDPDTTELHFALGNLFRRRGEFERAVRVHQHLTQRGDLSSTERERAQHALAQDYLKAGLLDRAEAGYRALEGTRFDIEARLALLQLHERSRDWRAASEDAARLEAAGTGSFASRVAHHWCELAQEAEERGDAAAAASALAQAQATAASSPRPWAQAGQRHARRGEHALALEAWTQLRQRHPLAFATVAAEYAASAAALGQEREALVVLQTAYADEPTLALLLAIDRLDADPARRQQRHAAHLAAHPTLSAAASVLREVADVPAAAVAAIDRASKPLQRYRCAACGFEAQRYFWQCPGCLSWDSFPPRPIEEQ